MIDNNLDIFLRELDEFNDEIGHAVGESLELIATETLKSVVDKTPIDTGRAKASWLMRSNNQNEKADIGKIFGKKLGRTEAKRYAMLTLSYAWLFTQHDVIHIYNDVPYITDLERGTSKQAPAGMAEVTVFYIDTFYGNLNQFIGKNRDGIRSGTPGY